MERVTGLHVHGIIIINALGFAYNSTLLNPPRIKQNQGMDFNGLRVVKGQDLRSI